MSSFRNASFTHHSPLATPSCPEGACQNEGRVAILTLVVAAACISLFAIGFMLNNTKGLSAPILTLHVTLSVVTVICSWLLTHTMFALHYAHYYYQDDSETPSSDKAGGLDFPSENQPDYWDFLYFSFVIGMTSQGARCSGNITFITSGGA